MDDKSQWEFIHHLQTQTYEYYVVFEEKHKKMEKHWYSHNEYQQKNSICITMHVIKKVNTYWQQDNISNYKH